MKRNRRQDGGDRRRDRERHSFDDDFFDRDFGSIESDDLDGESDDEAEGAPRDKRRFDQKRWRDDLIERSSERQRMRDRDLRRGLYKHSDRRTSIEDEASTLDAF